MSDGNFNRALLPKNELGAGLRAGRAQMRERAEKALMQALAECLPDLPTEQEERLRKRFSELMRN